MTQNLGRMIRGARPLAAVIFEDEEQWRTVLTPSLRRDLGLFLLGGRLCGYEGVIRQRLADKLEAATRPNLTTTA